MKKSCINKTSKKNKKNKLNKKSSWKLKKTKRFSKRKKYKLKGGNNNKKIAFCFLIIDEINHEEIWNNFLKM